MTGSADLTQFLHLAQAGDRTAIDRLFEAVYDELHRIAKAQRMRWDGNETVGTTVLVHEAYLKLVDQKRANWEDRSHFFAVAATAMRQILINYAEHRRAKKRGGDGANVPLDEGIAMTEETAEELLALDEALHRLKNRNPRQARIVELRFFVGLTAKETASVLSVSEPTVKRDWRMASAWLQKEIRTTMG